MNNIIMVFDLDEEIFQELTLPESLASEPPTDLNDAKCHFHVLHT